MSINDLEPAIEAILFVAPNPISTTQLAKLLDSDERSIDKNLSNLSKTLSQRGIKLLSNDNHHQLVSAPQYSDIVKPLIEQSAPVLSTANLEVLAIVAHYQPTTKSQIEQLRGVTSDKTIGNLLAKGLIAGEKGKGNPLDPIVYRTTTEFLRQVGFSSTQELKEFLDRELESTRD